MQNSVLENITNFTMFGCKGATIQAIRFELDENESDDEYFYQFNVGISLDDGNEIDQDSNTLMIFVETNIGSTDLYAGALECATYALELFGGINLQITVFDVSSMEIVDEIEIDEPVIDRVSKSVESASSMSIQNCLFNSKRQERQEQSLVIEPLSKISSIPKKDNKIIFYSNNPVEI